LENPLRRSAAVLMTAVLITAVLTPWPAAADDPVFDTDAVLGVWVTEINDDGANSHVEIFNGDNGYECRIVWLSKPLYGDDETGGEPGTPRLDHRNSDPALRSRPLMGLVLATGFEFNGKNKWEGGRIYDPESGKTYNAKITLKDQGTLELFGYVKVGFAKLGRDTIWRRLVAE